MRPPRLFPLAAALSLTLSQTAAQDPPARPPSEKLSLEALLARSNSLETAGDFSAAAAVLESAIPAFPDLPPGVIRHAGELRFFAGEIDASIALFDALVKRQPDSLPYLWQRGLSLYYAGKFEEGIRQFEEHQKVNPNDVENAAWHFICVARAHGLEAARKRLIPITGDSRIPMAEIHKLFAGTATPEDVLKSAAREGFGEDGLRNHLCFAHLYLALYHEANGDPVKALAHSKSAAVDFKMDHYMGRCAQVHHKLRSPAE